MNTLAVQKRNMETKAKKLRREGYVTGTIFGKEIKDTLPIMIERKEAERIQRECLKGSQLYVVLDGKQYDVILKELDYDPLKKQIIEMDFQALVKGEKVHSVAEIVLINKEKVLDGILEQHLQEVSYKALPENILDRIEVDCSTLRLGDVVKVGDLSITKNKKIEIMTHLNLPVVSVVPAHNAVNDETSAEAEKTE